jgi:predicted metal-binding membrane protein
VEGVAQALVGRDRLVILGGLAGVSALAWGYLLFDASRMHGIAMGDPGMLMAIKPWTAVDLVLTFLMWAVMMAAMMLPSVTAAVLVYAAILRRISPQQPHTRSVVALVLGYLLAWTGFSVGATALQWGLDRLAVLSPMLVLSSPFVGGALLIAAGIYQITPLKSACLEHCQNPLTYLAQNWAHGVSGALGMGSRHGLYCVGCCWAIMGLLFVGGVMNLLWVAAIAIFVLLEKLALLGGRLGQWVTAVLAAASGLAMITLAVFGYL